MNNVTKIWHILNEAVRGKLPVYELACKCKGLPEETIRELAQKLETDINTKPNSYMDWVKTKKTKQAIKEENQI